MPLQNRFNGFRDDDTIITENNYDSYDKPMENCLTHTNNFNRHNKATSKMYVNNFPEKNILPLNNRNQSNKNNEKDGRKITILSDSITKPIDMVEFNHYLVNGYTVKRAYGGATASQLSYYVLATLNEDKPDTIIISAGTNNLSKRWWQTEEDIASEVMQIVHTCHRNHVRKIYVSSITHRPKYQSKIDKINELLQYNAGIFNYDFINNSGISEHHLRRDGVHLNRDGVCILANNFLTHLNRPSLPFDSIWD